MRNAGRLVLLVALWGCSERRTGEKGKDPVPLADVPVYAHAEVIARDIQDPIGLAVDDTYVYWGDGGALRRAPKKGGPVAEVCRVEAARIESIAIAPDAIYFGGMGAGVFRRRDQEDAPCERIATETNPTSLAVVGNNVHYWNDGSARSVPRDRPGDAPAPTMWQAGYTGALVTDGTSLFLHQGREIGRTSLDGKDFAVLARTGHLGLAMAVDDTHLYWGDDLVEGVLRVPKSGGPLEWFSPVWSIGATLAVDKEWIFVMDIDDGVHAISKADGRSAQLVAGDLTGMGTNNVSLAFDAEQFFLADDSSRNRAAGITVVDLSKPNAELPDVIWEGVVARAPRRLDGVTFKPRPAAVAASTVYFSGDEAQDWSNATLFTRWRDERLTAAVAAGTLSVQLVAGVPDRDEARARRRAEAVAQKIRDEVGPKAVFEISTRAGKDGSVAVQFAPAAYAAVWAP
ncbi:MAG TPA: hypothetical protein VIG06_31290 [Kofleriaceae bacterium]